MADRGVVFAVGDIALPFCLVLFENFALGVVADDFDVDESA